MTEQYHKILEETAKEFSLGVEHILGLSRESDIVTARQVAMYLLHYEAKLSYPAIGKMLGRNHTTAMHGAAKISRLLADNKFLRQQMQSIKKAIYKK